MTATDTNELRLTEAAALAGRCEWTVRRWIDMGRVKARKVAGRLLIDRASLDEALRVAARSAPVEPKGAAHVG